MRLRVVKVGGAALSDSRWLSKLGRFVADTDGRVAIVQSAGSRRWWMGRQEPV